jgi:hypothetical protein
VGFFSSSSFSLVDLDCCTIKSFVIEYRLSIQSIRKKWVVKGYILKGRSVHLFVIEHHHRFQHRLHVSSI